MFYQDLVRILVSNIKTLLFLLLCYSLFCIFCCLWYNIYIRKESLTDSIKKCPGFLGLFLKFCYKPMLEFYNFDSFKKIFVRAFVPISELNIFWVTNHKINLKNANYKSNKGTIELKELILKKDRIEIIYNINSENNKFNLVKGKNHNNILIINNKEYYCNVDIGEKKIVVNYCGYYIFNDIKLIFKGKLRYDDSFKIEIDTSHFFDYEGQCSVKDLINICNLLCQICFFGCLVIFLLFTVYHFNWMNSPVYIVLEVMFVSTMSSLQRRVFDIYSEMNCDHQ